MGESMKVLTVQFLSLLLLALPGHPRLLAQTQPDQALLRKAREILKDVPIIDGHNDIPWQYSKRFGNEMDKMDLSRDTRHFDPPLHTDIPRLKAGGVGGQFWSVYIPVDSAGPGAVRAVYRQIDVVHQMVDRYADTFEMAYTADDIVRIQKAGKIASLIGLEGGHSIGNSLAVLRELYRSGARYMTLTHSKNNDWADSGTDTVRHNGLSPFGKAVVREMNRLGMLVDLSHTSPVTMHRVLDVVKAPVIFSHSSALALGSFPRNVPDDILKRLRRNGGLVMVTFVPEFLSDAVLHSHAAQDAEKKRLETLYPHDPGRAGKELEAWKAANPWPLATSVDIADHIDHIRKVAGIDHIGIGADYDGISTTPGDMPDVASYPVLFAELLRRGYSEGDLKKIAGLNVLRVMRAAEKEALRLQKRSRPSNATIGS